MVVGTDTNFEEEVLKADKLVLVDFWAEWCMPCRMIEPAVEELAEEYKDNLKVVKFNVDENPGIPGELGITGIPTLLLYKNGKIVDQIIGAVPKSQLEDVIKRNL